MQQTNSAGNTFVLCLTLCLLIPIGLAHAEQFAGRVTHYGREECIILDHFGANSGVNYSPRDYKKEAKLCGIDFDNAAIGLCPKTWSTSPATIIYDISKSRYNSHPETFEAEYCPRQRSLKGRIPGVVRLASYKQSVNGQFGQHTSATFSQASPLYYHFARYFNATVDVPVAVVRTMDARKHFERVTVRGRAIAPPGMISAGWKVVTSAETNLSGYSPLNEFYYGDPKEGLIYGTMLKGPGKRYGPEFNGNISGKGYSEEYHFLQQTPAFLALATPKDLIEAVNVGVNEARRDPVVAKALGAHVSTEQMIFWMTELSEICLLDYIFSQQDRPGNIDYVWVWYYIDRQGQLGSERADTKVSRAEIGSISLPSALKGSKGVYLIEKTAINDNDAGGRRYVNFTKRFGLLEKLRHLKAITYRQLIRLAKDFSDRGPMYSYLHDTFYLNNSYSELIVENSIQAASILQAACKAGTVKFDLNPETYLMTGKVEDVKVDCVNP
jgi:hypothetical protein